MLIPNMSKLYDYLIWQMKNYSKDVTEVEVKPDASWYPKVEGYASLREHWHQPDRSIIISIGKITHQQGNLNQVKCESIAFKNWNKEELRWYPKLEGYARLHEHWHRPDRSIIISIGKITHQQGNLNQVKCEGIFESQLPLKIGIKRN